MRVLLACRIGVACLIGLSTAGMASNALVISSPRAGTVVAPGQLLSVSVAVTGSYPNGIGIVGGSPGVMQGPQPVSDPTFGVTIPTGAPAGPFTIAALGVNSAGTLTQSASVTLDVERSDLPQSITLLPARAQFDFVGDSLSLDSVTGTYADGSQMDLRQSSLLQVSTSSSAIAIFQNGRVIAAGPGGATMTFSVGGASQTIVVIVPSSIRGDLGANGRVDSDDVAIIEQALNTPDTIVGDARDLNGDGEITSADVTIEKTLCTVQKPLCSTE